MHSGGTSITGPDGSNSAIIGRSQNRHLAPTRTFADVVDEIRRVSIQLDGLSQQA